MWKWLNENNGLKDEVSILMNENNSLKDKNLTMAKSVIESVKQLNGTKDFAVSKLVSDFGKSHEKAEALVAQCWEQP